MDEEAAEAMRAYVIALAWKLCSTLEGSMVKSKIP